MPRMRVGRPRWNNQSTGSRTTSGYQARLLHHPTSPVFKRVIKPANSGPTFDIGETKIVNRIIIDRGYKESEDDDIREPKVVAKWKDTTRQWRVTIRKSLTILQEEVIDATKTRRLKHDEWSNIDINRFLKKAAQGDSKHKILHSETPEANDIYKAIDERAYRTKHELKSNGWKHHNLDEWIDICHSAARVEGQSAQELALMYSESALMYSELLDDHKKVQSELTAKGIELSYTYNDFEKVDDELGQVSQLLEDADYQSRMYREQLEHTQKGMRTLERRLRREREEFAAHRAHIQAAANATTAEIVAGSSSGRGGGAAAGHASRRCRGGHGARRGGAGASGRGGH